MNGVTVKPLHNRLGIPYVDYRCRVCGRSKRVWLHRWYGTIVLGSHCLFHHPRRWR